MRFGFGFFGAIFVGFVYTFILRIPGWRVLASCGASSSPVGVFWLALAAMCYQNVFGVAWKADEDRDANQANGMLYLAYFCEAGIFVGLHDLLFAEAHRLGHRHHQRSREMHRHDASSSPFVGVRGFLRRCGGCSSLI